MIMSHGKDLEKDACEKFVCPNMSLIDEKGKELQLKDNTIEKAKELARHSGGIKTDDMMLMDK